MIETTTPDVLLSINDEFLAGSGELGSNTVIGTIALDVSIIGNLTSEYQNADPGSFGDLFPPLLIPISDKFLAGLELGSNAVTESTELVVDDLADGSGEVEIGSFTERALLEGFSKMRRCKARSTAAPTRRSPRGQRKRGFFPEMRLEVVGHPLSEYLDSLPNKPRARSDTVRNPSSELQSPNKADGY
jgi:hypothetical protein